MLQRASPILAAAASPALLAKGCVSVMELDTLKEVAGPAWARIREGVYSRLETMLHSKLGPNDLFVRLGETSYLVTMPTTEPEDVSAICTRVAFDLYTSFLGQCDLSKLRVNTVAAGDDDTLLLKRIPLDKMVSLAQRAGVPTDAINKALHGLPSLDVSEQPQHSHHGKIGAHHHAVAHSYVPIHRPRAVQAAYHFIPVWSVPNAAVTTYACEPKAVYIDNISEPVPLIHLTTEERIEVELEAMHKGIEHLTNAWSGGDRFLLAVPISFEVFGNPSGRMEVLATCRDLSSAYRSYLTFVIYDIPLGVAQSRLANMVTALKPFGRGVLATIAPNSRNFDTYVGLGLRGIGFNLREFSAQISFTPRDAEQLAQFGRRNNLLTFLWDVRDKTVLKYAQDASIQHLTGTAVAPACIGPQGMLRLGWEQVLAKPIVELWL